MGGGGGNAVSASHNFTVENGGKYGDIEGLLGKVADSGEDKEKCKIWYLEEKQAVLLWGTRSASERVAEYLSIANIKNPNIRIDALSKRMIHTAKIYHLEETFESFHKFREALFFFLQRPEFRRGYPLKDIQQLCQFGI